MPRCPTMPLSCHNPLHNTFERMARAWSSNEQLPVHRTKGRSDFVTLTRTLLVDIVAEVGAVPNDDVLILDVLAVHEFVDAGFGTGPRSAVVNLGGMVEHDPNIATA